MSRIGRWFSLCACFGLLACAVAWAQTEAKPDAKAAKAAKAGIAGYLNGEPITLQDVDAKALGKNMNLAQQLYDARKQAFDAVIMERLLAPEAKTQGVTVDALIEKRLAEKMTPVSDDDVKSFYESNKARMGNQTLEQVSGQIRDYLKSQRDTEARANLVKELKANQKIQVTIDAPRVEVKLAANDPIVGPASAKVTIVEYSDFQCPYCSRGHATMDEVRKAYGDKIRLAFRHYPLPFHNRAEPAAIASDCANEQGKFWEYHDKLFTNQQALEDANLKQYAVDLGLDTSKFNQCLESAKYKADVQKDMKDGQEAGVTGTPAFFVNGRFLNGAQPIEAFKVIIDEELETSQ